MFGNKRAVLSYPTPGRKSSIWTACHGGRMESHRFVRQSGRPTPGRPIYPRLRGGRCFRRALAGVLRGEDSMMVALGRCRTCCRVSVVFSGYPRDTEVCQTRCSCCAGFPVCIIAHLDRGSQFQRPSKAAFARKNLPATSPPVNRAHTAAWPHPSPSPRHPSTPAPLA